MSEFLLEGHKLKYHTPRVNDFLEHDDCFPLYIEVSPVGRCNHRCKFCAYDFIGYPNRKLDTEKFLSTLTEFSEVGVKSILYAGEGEPLLHPDILSFVRKTVENKIDCGMFTNGALLKKDLSENLLPLLTFLRFSFNAGTAENYSLIHHVSDQEFNKVVKNIEDASMVRANRKLPLDLGAQFVILPENQHTLLDAIKTVKDSGINYLAVKPFVLQNQNQLYKLDEDYTIKKLEELFAEAEMFSTKDFKVVIRREAFEGYGKRNYNKCFGTSFISCINSAGDVASCLPYWERKEFVYGNIYENSFQEIWKSETRKKIKNYLHCEIDTQKCPPNCRPNAVNEYLWEIKNPSVKHLNFI